MNSAADANETNLKLVVGLGNPGRKYFGTRHNIGFEVLGELARRHSAPATKSRFESELTEVLLGSQRILLAAPQTFMNLSGRAVRQIVDFYRLPLDQLLVVCDDINLDTARLRLRASGTAGGQKGLNNIIQQLGTNVFSRLRIGVGMPPGQMDSADYVLSKFMKSEHDEMQHAVVKAADGVELWARVGVQAAMNEVNRAPEGSRNSENADAAETE
jgi:PTH1 family peptidyl-tRNA hydrolase